MAGEVIVDALPYIDQGYDEPGVREAVNSFYVITRGRIFRGYIMYVFILTFSKQI